MSKVNLKELDSNNNVALNGFLNINLKNMSITCSSLDPNEVLSDDWELIYFDETELNDVLLKRSRFTRKEDETKEETSITIYCYKDIQDANSGMYTRIMYSTAAPELYTSKYDIGVVNYGDTKNFTFLRSNIIVVVNGGKDMSVIEVSQEIDKFLIEISPQI